MLALSLTYGLPAFSSTPSASLAAWNGFYNVSKCIHCPDVKVENGANLKNFSWFGIGSGAIDKKDLLDCAQTNIWFGYSINIKSDDGNVSSTSNSNSGQCDWGFNENIEVTNDSLLYSDKGYNSSGKKVEMSLKRISQDTFEFNLHVSDQSPSWGYPSEWEYKAELKKANE